MKKEDVNVVQTDVNSKTGVNRCPKCGASSITFDIKNGKLKCEFCRYEFEPVKVEGFSDDIKSLKGKIIGSGAKDIDKNASDIITLKCESCGAEVVINTVNSTQARCHWCRNMLSINNQIPNGSVPDVILPFLISKEEASKLIEGFVHKRKFFAHPKFRKEFSVENVMGVYFPYMAIDINSHAVFSGEGEHLVRTYQEGDEDHKQTYYDADLYKVKREFDIAISGLTVESNSERRDKSVNTNNVINAIMPFDIEKSVKFDSNYLNGFTSEKRDSNIGDLKTQVGSQIRDVARFAINNTLYKYDRGVKWMSENMEIKGQQWKAAYLPVWLYSYQAENKVLHYVAVNARTKEVMGSIPVNFTKLFIVSFLIDLVCFLLLSFADDYRIMFWALFPGIIYFLFMYLRYRNFNARHSHEKETKSDVSNMKSDDVFVKQKCRLSSSWMTGANNNLIGLFDNGNVYESSDSIEKEGK